MRFSMAGVTCDAPAAGAAVIRLRTSLDGAAWGPWLEAPLELAGEGAAATAFTDAVWTGPARYVQVAAVTAGDAGPATLSGVRLVAIDPTEDGSVGARVTGAARRLAATVAGVSFDSPATAAAAAPVIVTRSEWGADESLRNAAPSYAPVKMAFVHHTASGNLYTRADAPALVRGVYAYHTQSLHWNDIAYNFLVDRFGTIYEGRYGGVTRGVVGAHVYGFNTGSTGVSVMGTFIDEAPPAEAVTALERLLAWKLGIHGLDPAGTARLTCGAAEKYAVGATVTFPVIAGHRQANYTECPGSALYALLPAVRTDVAKRVGTTVVATLTASTPLISPNGDGVLDAAALDVGITTTAAWRLTVRDAGGQTVASWSGDGASAAVTWDGTSGGADVPDGVVHRGAHRHPVRRRGGGREHRDHRRHGGAAPHRRSGAGVVQPERRRPDRVGRRHLHAPRRPATSVSASWTQAATWSAGSTAGGRARPAPTRSRGTAGSGPAAPDRGRRRAVPLRHRATRRGRQRRPPGRQGRRGSHRRLPRRPPRRPSPPATTAPATRRRSGSSSRARPR